MFRRLAVAYFAGSVAALVASLALSLVARSTTFAEWTGSSPHLVPAFSWEWLAPRLLWGSLFGCGYPLLRRRLSPVRAGLVLSLIPSAIDLLLVQPQAGRGVLALAVGPAAPALVVTGNALWGYLIPQVIRCMRGLGPVLT